MNHSQRVNYCIDVIGAANLACYSLRDRYCEYLEALTMELFASDRVVGGLVWLAMDLLYYLLIVIQFSITLQAYFAWSSS